MNELDRVEAQALREAVVHGGGSAAMAGGALCVRHDRVAMPELNRAIPLGSQVDVRAIADWYGGHPHAVAVPPGYLGLAESLAAAGYVEAAPWVKFSRNDAPASPAPTDLRIEQTLDASAFGAAMSSPDPELNGFVGAPGWLHFVGWDGDLPVASGALYVEGELAWVGVGATQASHRGRGAQSALIAARVEAGRALGVKRFACETGPDGPSSRNLRRAGFHEAYVRPNWASQPSR